MVFLCSSVAIPYALAALTAAPDCVKSLRVDHLGVELRHVRGEAVVQSLELRLVWQNVSQRCHIFSATKLGLQRLVIDGLRDVAQLVSLLALQAGLAHMLVVGDFVAYKWTCSLVDRRLFFHRWLWLSVLRGVCLRRTGNGVLLKQLLALLF